MKATRSKIPARKIDRSSLIDAYLSYDVDNMYMERVTNLVNSSPIAVACIDTKSGFVEGDGFLDKAFYKLIVNSDGVTNDKLLRFISKDLILRNGFAVHINYDATFKKTEFRNIPFHDCRRGNPKNKDFKNKIGVYDKWTDRSFNKEEINCIDRFNPDPVIIQQQVESLINGRSITTIEEAWKAYKGQIYWYSSEGENYPLAPFDATLEAIETDGRISKWKRKNAANSFNLQHYLIHKGKFETDNEREEFIQGIKDFQGEDASNVCVIDLEQDEEKPEILNIPQPDAKGNFYVVTEDKVQDNIRMGFSMPGVLIGINQQGALGLSTQMTDAYAVVNSLTNKHRRLIEETMKLLFENFVNPLPTDQDFSIIPLSYNTGNDKAPLAIQFGVGGTTGIQSLLVDALLTPQQKINTLIILFGLTFEQANSMVTGAMIPTEEVPE